MFELTSSNGAFLIPAITAVLLLIGVLLRNIIPLFKKILFLIVLDDMYDWSDYLDAPQPI